MNELNDTNRITLLERRTKENEDKISGVNSRLNTMEKNINENHKTLTDKLDKITHSQHQYDINNLKVSNTLQNINEYIKSENKKKDESKKDMKQIKNIAIGAGFTFGGSLILAILQILF